MDDEILLAGAVVFKIHGGKIFWLIVKPGKDDNWQLPKGVVRRGESSVRTAIRNISETAGIRGRVLEEAGRASFSFRTNGTALSRKVIYYLMQQKGKEAVELTVQLTWIDFARARLKLFNATERRILLQAKTVLSEWQKQQAQLDI